MADRRRPRPVFQVGRSVIGLRQAQARSGHLPGGDPQAGVDPARCVYVGDNPARDVVGARSGFGMVIILPEPRIEDPPVADEYQPDLIIHRLSDLLDVFPEHDGIDGAGVGFNPRLR